MKLTDELKSVSLLAFDTTPIIIMLNVCSFVVTQTTRYNEN